MNIRAKIEHRRPSASIGGRITLLLLATVVIALSTGCVLFPVMNVHNEDNPYRRDIKIQRVAVAPFVFGEKTAELRYDFDLNAAALPDGRCVVYSADIAREFGQELAQFRGFEVIPPAQVIQAWRDSVRDGDEQNPLASAHGARAIARLLRADAIIVGEVRSYDPYDYPRLELAWQVLYTGNLEGSADEIRRMERRGNAKPFAFDKDYAKWPLYCADEVIDSRSEVVNASLEDYAYSLRTRGSGFESGPDAIRKRAWPDYFRFASWYCLRAAFDYERARR